MRRVTIDGGFDQLHYAHLLDVAHPDPCTPLSEHVGFQVEVDRLAALIHDNDDGDTA